MRVSVCMGIYNGEAYIEEQLLSILKQTRQPEEVILCDDCSTDATVKMVTDFIARHQLQQHWILYQNKETKGYPGNFYYAMSLCGGDVVFLADQDDIWHSEKVEKMMQVMEQHGEAVAVCCKFGLIDAEGEDIRTVMTPTRSRGTAQLRRVDISDVFYKCEWPGMVMAYRKQWYDECETDRKHLRIPHDFLIAAWAAEQKGFLQMDEVLAYHRRHEHNAGGEEHRLRRLLNKRRKLREIEIYLTILEAFSEEKVLRTERGAAALQRKLCSMRGRYDALCSGRICRVLGNARQQRREVRLATVICDLMIVRQK